MDSVYLTGPPPPPPPTKEKCVSIGNQFMIIHAKPYTTCDLWTGHIHQFASGP